MKPSEKRTVWICTRTLVHCLSCLLYYGVGVARQQKFHFWNESRLRLTTVVGDRALVDGSRGDEIHAFRQSWGLVIVGFQGTGVLR